jgi:hypothetical protein
MLQAQPKPNSSPQLCWAGLVLGRLWALAWPSTSLDVIELNQLCSDNCLPYYPSHVFESVKPVIAIDSLDTQPTIICLILQMMKHLPLWTSSLRHHHICIVKISTLNQADFLIPLVKKLLINDTKTLTRQIFDNCKIEEVIYFGHSEIGHSHATLNRR